MSEIFEGSVSSTIERTHYVTMTESQYSVPSRESVNIDHQRIGRPLTFVGRDIPFFEEELRGDVRQPLGRGCSCQLSQ